MLPRWQASDMHVPPNVIRGLTGLGSGTEVYNVATHLELCRTDVRPRRHQPIRVLGLP